MRYNFFGTDSSSVINYKVTVEKRTAAKHSETQQTQLKGTP
jgi:hypothetical protein